MKMKRSIFRKTQQNIVIFTTLIVLFLFFTIVNPNFVDRYNILQMIRNDTSVTSRPAERNGLLNKNLFKAGESFTMSKFAKQFVNSGKLNDRSDLGFKFEVKSVYENFAEIAITKL